MLHNGCKSLTSIAKWRIYWWSYGYSCFYSSMSIRCFLFVVFMGQRGKWSSMILTHIKGIIYYFCGGVQYFTIIILCWILFMCGFQWWNPKMWTLFVIFMESSKISLSLKVVLLLKSQNDWFWMIFFYKYLS